MARFKLSLRDARRKVADLDVEVNQQGVKIEDARNKALLGCVTWPCELSGCRAGSGAGRVRA